MDSTSLSQSIRGLQPVLRSLGPTDMTKSEVGARRFQLFDQRENLVEVALTLVHEAGVGKVTTQLIQK